MIMVKKKCMKMIIVDGDCNGVNDHNDDDDNDDNGGKDLREADVNCT